MLEGGPQPDGVEKGNFEARVQDLTQKYNALVAQEKEERDRDETAYYHGGGLERHIHQQSALSREIKNLVTEQLEKNHPGAIQTIQEVEALDRVIEDKEQEYENSYSREAYFRAQSALDPHSVGYEAELSKIRSGGEPLQAEINALRSKREGLVNQLPSLPGLQFVIKR